MKMNKIKILPALCLALALVGCGGQTPAETTQPTTPSTSETTLATQPTTEATTEPTTETGDQLREVTYGQLEDFLTQWAEDCWESEGDRLETVRVTGLCTPVELTLDGMTVKEIGAYGRTLPVEIEPDEGDVYISLGQWQDSLVINGNGCCWLLTREQTYDFPVQDGIVTWLWLGENGELEYHKSACAAEFMEQWVTAPLDSATDRGNLYSEEGIVTMLDGEPVLTVKERILMGDRYDFDALFALARIRGWNDYEGCENADDVLRKNKEESEPWLTYPYEPKEPAQRLEFEGLTLNLPVTVTQEEQEEGVVLLRGEFPNEEIVLRVTTGEAEKGYRGLEESITSPAQMLDWDWANRGDMSVANFTLRGVPCLYVYNDETENIRGYYLKGNRWWVIEVEDLFTEWMPTYAACGAIE